MLMASVGESGATTPNIKTKSEGKAPAGSSSVPVKVLLTSTIGIFYLSPTDFSCFVRSVLK